MSPCHPVPTGGSGPPPATETWALKFLQKASYRGKLRPGREPAAPADAPPGLRAILDRCEAPWSVPGGAGKAAGSRSMALPPLFLLLRLLSPPRRAGHAPCRERPALQHPLRGAARPSVRAAGHTDFVTRRSAAAERACVPGWRGETPVRKADGSRGFVGGKVSPNTASAATSSVLQSGCFCNMENYHHGSPLRKGALGSRGSKL